MRKHLLCVLCCVLLLSALPLAVAARDVPDLSRLGSVSVTLSHKGEPVTDGSFTLYRVAYVADNNGKYSFRLIDALSDKGIRLENLSDSQLAAQIEAAIQSAGITGVTETADDNGKVSFSELSLGLYLLVQQDAAPGYNPVEPFLVAVPNLHNGIYLYDVDASPKMELEPAPTTEPTETTESTTPTTVPGKLPQTGQNNWPVPVLMVVGMLFVAAGCWLLLSGKEKHHEE